MAIVELFHAGTSQDRLISSRTREDLPPYDILKVDEDQLRITVALPGFHESDLGIEVHNRLLKIKGNKAIDPFHNHYVRKGIFSSGFELTFELSRHLEVKGAKFDAGLLNIDLIQEVPEELKPKRILVNGVQARALPDPG